MTLPNWPRLAIAAHFVAIILATQAIAFPIHAQSLSGENRPSNWRVTFQEQFGLYSTFCDEREASGTLEKRCYIRYVDVFSPRPDFGAIFFFITPQGSGNHVDFGLEPGTTFERNGFRIERDGMPLWVNDRVSCHFGFACAFEGDEGASLIALMREEGSFMFEFTDRNGAPQQLNWPLTGFDEAYSTYMRERAARGL